MIRDESTRDVSVCKERQITEACDHCCLSFLLTPVVVPLCMSGGNDSCVSRTGDAGVTLPLPGNPSSAALPTVRVLYTGGAHRISFAKALISSLVPSAWQASWKAPRPLPDLTSGLILKVANGTTSGCKDQRQALRSAAQQAGPTSTAQRHDTTYLDEHNVYDCHGDMSWTGRERRKMPAGW